MEAFIDSCIALKNVIKPSMLYIICNDSILIEQFIEAFPDLPAIVATCGHDSQLISKLEQKKVSVKRIVETPTGSFDVLDQAKNLLLEACVEGIVDIRDRMLCILATNISACIAFDVRDVGIAKLKDAVKDRISIHLLSDVLDIAFSIAREGKEGAHFGALFVIGDTENVMKKSSQMIINPFEKHKIKDRKVSNPDNWHTIKQFAQLDGAVIINEKGIAVAAGRYIQINFAEIMKQSLDVDKGLGTRHLAAASISKDTKAISVVVSSSSNIKIYKDGLEIFSLDTI